jgi:N-acetylmuramic acid 6-phosphate etherase
VDHGLVVGLIAGGEGAIFKAVEGAEDRRELGEADLKKIGFSKKDILVGIAASGRTPYVIGALQYADQIGALSASICCNRGSVISSYAKYPIEVDTGPEILTGSTRLKAGTATKMVLNMISTAAMVKTGETYGNLMVDVKQTNDKLHLRAIRIVKTATGVDETTAKETLAKADGDCKTAIVMLLGSCTKEEAIKCIEQNNGMIRKAIQEEKDI